MEVIRKSAQSENTGFYCKKGVFADLSFTKRFTVSEATRPLPTESSKGGKYTDNTWVSYDICWFHFKRHYLLNA